MLITITEKYSIPLQLDLVHLKFQAEVAKNTSLDRKWTANYLHATVCRTVEGAAGISWSVGTGQGDSNNSSSASIILLNAASQRWGVSRTSMSATRTSDLNLITVVERQLSCAVFDDAESAFDTFGNMGSRRIILRLNENTVMCATVIDSASLFYSLFLLKS